MKINSTPYPFFGNLVKQEKSPNSGDSKSVIKEQLQKLPAANSSTGENNAKVQALLNKFKSGKKLSLGEMNYLRTHAPGLVAKIEQVHMERAIYEQAMKGSPTKMGVHLVALQASKQISDHSSGEDTELRLNHLQNAVAEYTATEEYRQKPEAVLNEQKDKDKKWKQHTANDVGKLYASTSRGQVYELQLNNAITIDKRVE